MRFSYGGERVKEQVNYVEWVNPNTYNYVTLGNKSMKTDEYNKLVSEILHLTNQQGLSISMLESCLLYTSPSPRD